MYPSNNKGEIMINVKDLHIRDPFFYFEDGYYYLYSSFQDKNDIYPSFVCYKTKDLINFEEPKTIFKRPNDFWATKDFWAPEMHKYKGKYYLFASLKSEDKCRATQIFVSNKPDGEYKTLTDKPITPSHLECLDGTLFVENDIPYIVYCNEWLQVKDGKMFAQRLSDDLKETIGDPILLFRASEAKWTIPFSQEGNYVTDGPFIIKRNNKLNMIWSSFAKDGYAVGVCESESILGPWVHKEDPIYKQNGGHAMVFKKNDELLMTLHCPNEPFGDERLVLLPLKDYLK